MMTLIESNKTIRTRTIVIIIIAIVAKTIIVVVRT